MSGRNDPARGRPSLTLALAAGLAAAPVPEGARAHALPDACPAAAMPEIAVTKASHSVEENRGRSLAELSAADPGHQAGLDGGIEETLEARLHRRGYRVDGTPGLTEFTLRSSFDMAYLLVRRGDTACVMLERLGIGLEGTSIVNVASDYEPGSCEYGVTHAHEARHVAVNRAFIDDLPASFPAEVRRRVVTTVVAGPAGDLEGLQSRLADAVRQAVDDAVSASMDRLSDRQAGIDTEEEYLRLSRACTGW